MKRKVLFGIIFLCFAFGIFSVVPNVSADEVVATVIDTAGSETKVYDLYLYHKWCEQYGKSWDGQANRVVTKCLYWDDEKTWSLEVKKGETDLTISFSNILEMKFEWAENLVNSSVTISTVSGERIKGTPYYGGRSFKGKTDYGNFELSMTKTKKVIFSHAITPSSTIPTVTTTHTPILTPTSSLGETMSPCEKGYKDCYPPWGDCETNIYEDNDNCGDCGNQCPEGYFCLLGSCVENTTANKEKLAAYYMEQYQRYDEEKRFDNAKNYLLKAKDVYIDINRSGQVLEIDGLIEEIEEKIFEKEIFELVFEVAIAVILAVFFGYIFERKTKKFPLWVVVTSSAVVFFIVFLVLRLLILPIFY